MEKYIVFDTDSVGNKTVQILEDSQPRNLTYGDVESKDIKDFIKSKLGENLKDSDRIRFTKNTLNSSEENELYAALREEFE